jgi:hypothetical protein
MSSHYDVARALVDSLTLHGSELDSHVDRATTREYWAALVPDQTIDAPPPPPSAPPPRFDPSSRDEVIGQFTEQGYLRTGPVLSPQATAGMRKTIHAVAAADWPPVFAWIYDAFWRAPRVPPLAHVFTGILGDDYRQSPFVWTHIVPGERGRAGWPPHADNSAEEFRLTVWIALSEASLDSGCIALVPRHLAPAARGDRWHDQPSLPMTEALALLHAARPLPVPAGAVLAWDAGMLHWGCARTVAGEPRMSLSMELVPAGSPASVLDRTFAGVGDRLPDFEHRLRMIAEAIILYGERELRLARYLQLGERLLARLGG